MQKKALVTGAAGFIGHHLANYLKDKGYWVRGVDIQSPEYSLHADEFHQLDLRERANCLEALALPGGKGFDEVYQLAADMGGMGFISVADREVLYNNALINLHMTRSAQETEAARYFFSSSVCIYRDMEPDETQLTEKDAYPALPDNDYGWEKLYSERVALAHGRTSPMNVRIARFENTYGLEGAWRGGREKAPAAICRKVAEAKDGGTIEVWGDGEAIRVFTYVDDLVRGIYALMQSDIREPTNLGSNERVTVNDLVHTVIRASGKNIHIQHGPGPVGVQSRNFSKERAHSLGWKVEYSLADGIARTYPWVEQQVLNSSS